MYKMFVSDLDETLLRSDGTVSLENIAAIKSLTSLGVKFVPNTGRSYFSVQPLLKTLGLFQKEQQFVISYNGACIIENKDLRIIQSNELPYEQAKVIFDIMSHFENTTVHVYTLTDLFIYNPSKNDNAYLSTRGVDFHVLKDHDFSQFANKKIMKVIAANTSLKKRIEIHDLIEWSFEKKITVTYSSGRYVEVNKLGVDKGVATIKLGEKLGIDANEILGIGDSMNDLALLKKVGMPVAVQNGLDEVKKVAKYITSADNSTGIAEAINKFIL